MLDLRNEILELKDEVISLRREIHMYPEVGFEEHRTSSLISSYLKNVGLEVEEGIAETGVVGLLFGKEKGKTVMLRADMDALPISEANEVPYKSRNAGVMHACGHDGHTAMLLCAAKILSRHADLLRGNVKFVFQPSEERDPGGAIKLIEAGVLENPKVNFTFGLHLSNLFPVSSIALRKGIFMAQADRFSILIKGIGGHGAYPHLLVDPILVASNIIMALQSIVSRETSPSESVVVSIGELHSGSTFNAIPETAYIEGTVRTLNKLSARTVPESIERIANNIATAYRANIEFEYNTGYPPLLNNEKMTEFIMEVATGIHSLRIIEAPISMGGEDMSYYLEKVPGAFFWLGSSNKEKGIDKPLHSPYFDIDEDALLTGIEMHVNIALKIFGFDKDSF